MSRGVWEQRLVLALRPQNALTESIGGEVVSYILGQKENDINLY